MSTCHVFDEYQDLLYLSGESAYLHFGWHVSDGFSMELVSLKIVSWSSALRCGSASNSFSHPCLSWFINIHSNGHIALDMPCIAVLRIIIQIINAMHKPAYLQWNTSWGYNYIIYCLPYWQYMSCSDLQHIEISIE